MIKQSDQEYRDLLVQNYQYLGKKSNNDGQIYKDNTDYSIIETAF